MTATSDGCTIRVQGGDSADSQPRSWPVLRRQPGPGRLGCDELGAFLILFGAPGPGEVRELVQLSAENWASRRAREMAVS